MAKFELDKYELERAEVWNEKHLQEFHKSKEPYCGAIGGRVSYEIIYTSLGYIIRINCLICRNTGKKLKEYSEDTTDYTDW